MQSSRALTIKDRVYSDSPAKKVREACAHTVAENTRLMVEITELRAQIRESAIRTTPTSKSGPVIRSIVSISDDEGIFARPGFPPRRNTDKIKKMSDKNSSFLTSPSNGAPLSFSKGASTNLSDGVSPFDEERLVERVTDNVTRALKNFLSSRLITSVSSMSSHPHNVLDATVHDYERTRDSTDSIGRSQGLNVKFNDIRGEEDVRSYHKEFPSLQRPRDRARVSQGYRQVDHSEKYRCECRCSSSSCNGYWFERGSFATP